MLLDIKVCKSDISGQILIYLPSFYKIIYESSQKNLHFSNIICHQNNLSEFNDKHYDWIFFCISDK